MCCPFINKSFNNFSIFNNHNQNIIKFIYNNLLLYKLIPEKNILNIYLICKLYKIYKLRIFPKVYKLYSYVYSSF